MKAFLETHSAYNQAPAKIRENCPTLNPLVLGLRLFDRELRLSPDLARILIGDEAETKLYEALLAKKDNRLDRWAQLLREVARQHAEDPRPAYLLLAHDKLGTMESLDDDQANELRTHLDDRYRELLSAVQAISRNDLVAVQEREDVLASFDDHEIGYELAIRMRILWRISDGGPNRRKYNREALDLISRAIPFLGSDALIPFRVAAAIGGDRPEIALAGSVGYAKSVVDRIKRGKITDSSRLQSLRSNLIKCRGMVSERAAFESIPKQRYTAALAYLDKVIAGEA